MLIPESINTIENLIDKYHENNIERPRPHLGASMLGHPCDRYIWLSFRWAIKSNFIGRILRLFRRGRLEESQIISDLRSIGIGIRGISGKQIEVNFGCHVKGSLDAVIERGVPEAPKAQHVAEFKTHSLSSFNDLKKKGLKESKPEHYAQMQVYMHGTNIDRGLYLAVCKNDDHIYTERIKYDNKFAQKLVDRGKRLALSERLPEPISANPSWFQCKRCPAQEFCHKTKLTTEVNCRTCSHITPESDGTWKCEFHNSNVPENFQYDGCEGHVLHPDLVPWEQGDALDEWTATYKIGDSIIGNGQPHAENKHVFSSKEIISNPELCANKSHPIHNIRNEFDGRIL